MQRTIDDAARVTRQNLRREICYWCRGNGFWTQLCIEGEFRHRCHACNGRGYVITEEIRYGGTD